MQLATLDKASPDRLHKCSENKYRTSLNWGKELIEKECFFKN